MRRTCQVAFEVAGPAAMFTRPDTGATPISYPVPTYSAAKGMFDAVARLRSVYVHPTRVEICRPIRYERYVTNYGGPLRKSTQIRNGNNYQLIATILVDVCYRVYAELRGKKRSGAKDQCKKLRDMIDQRLIAGRNFYTPCLGWKEFVPAYFGPLRDGTKPCEDVELTIPSLLHSMWKHRQLEPMFRQNVRVTAGIMLYEQEEVIHAQ